MLRSLAILVLFFALPLAADAQDEPAATAPPETPKKAPPERTYSEFPFVHRIVLLDEDGQVIKPPKPGEEATSQTNVKPMSQAKTCGKCHSDYDVMATGWHFNFSNPTVPKGRNGEPWILTDAQTRTALPLSYRGWKGTFHPHDVGINDFNFARLFGRHHTGGGALQNSTDLRMKMSGALEIDCLICHTSDERYDPVARATQISVDQNFKYAPTLAAFLGKVQGSASKLRDNFDPTGPDAKRAPKIAYDTARFNDVNEVVLDVAKRVSNERCYFCHTNVDVGRPTSGDGGLESRWRHDRDIHLLKGMSCVDCHQHGADHMIARGYEGEYEDRLAADQKFADSRAATAEKSITTLSCQGCHYGTDTLPGGRAAGPRPLHRGLPTLHFDKLSCTACHSGPSPSDATTLVQTAMAHKLGLPRHHTSDAAAPTIQQPVFITDERTGKLTPHRMIYPSFWARLENEKLKPMLPEEILAADVESILGEKPDPKHFDPMAPLTEQQIIQILDKLAAATPPAIKPADAIGAPTTMPATAPSTTQASPAGEPVFVTGAWVYKRAAGGKLESFWREGASPYYWPIGHDVRGAQQALGARGCVECHATPAPIFDSKVSTASLIANASVLNPMHAARPDSIASLRLFAATYPLRWLLILIGYVSAGVVGLVLIKQVLRVMSQRSPQG